MVPNVIGTAFDPLANFSAVDWLGANLLPLSPGGQYLYAVGAWIDAGAPRRQIVRSADLGATWCVLATPEDVSMVIPAPVDPLIIYAVTAADASGKLGTGLLRSTDGGATWEDRPGGFPYNPTLAFPPVSVHVVGDGQTIWIPGTADIYLSRDGGGSWTEVPFPVRGQVSAPIIFDPRTPARLLGQGGSGMLASDDFGATWSDVALPGSLIGVDAFSALYASDDMRKLSRSCDWGKTWTVTGRMPALTGLVANVALHPLGSHRFGELFQISLNIAWDGYDHPVALARSTDAGANWTRVSLPDAVSIVLPVGSGERLVVRTPSGLSSSSAGGAWAAGPSVLDGASHLVASPADPLTVWASSGSTLYRSRDGGASFAVTALAPASGQQAGQPLVDGLSADVAYAAGMRTEDGGATWHSIPTFGWLDVCPPPRSCLHAWSTPGPDGWRTLSMSSDHGSTWTQLVQLSGLPATSPVAADPLDDLHFLAGSRMGIYETTDGGHTWIPYPIGGNDPIDVADIVFASRDTAIALTTSVGLGGAIYRSDDGGSSFRAYGTVPFAVATTARLRHSAAHPATWFVVPGDGQTPIHRSDDDTLTWAPERMAAAAVIDGPDGGYRAQIPGYGLVHFR
jgi:photosystem II stability/assembly factor-like uncharacterized protein